MVKPSDPNGPAAQQARRSLTPSPEKPNLGALAQQRRALTPNPQQQPSEPHIQVSSSVERSSSVNLEKQSIEELREKNGAKLVWSN